MLRVFCTVIAFCLLSSVALADPRIKDIADVEGVRENQLVGYGIVVGLNGTGDSLRNAPFTEQALESLLENFDNNVRDTQLNTGNVAAVMLTADLPPFAMQGTRIDVSVSTIGDASSLQGGMLVATALKGANDEVFAVAQGPITVGGFAAEGEGASITRGAPTGGRIPNGAIIERELDWNIAQQREIRLALKNPDFTTARRMSDVINAYLGTDAAKADNPAIVTLNRPTSFSGDMVGLLAEIEQLRVQTDMRARIVIDENTGTIVMGDSVRVSTVAIAQGGLTISITESPIASQANAFAPGGETLELPRTDITVEEDLFELGIIPGTVSLRELVDGLNALGVSPRDMITILQTIKAAGALQAEIEVL